MKWVDRLFDWLAEPERAAQRTRHELPEDIANSPLPSTGVSGEYCFFCERPVEVCRAHPCAEVVRLNQEGWALQGKSGVPPSISPTRLVDAQPVSAHEHDFPPFTPPQDGYLTTHPAPKDGEVLADETILEAVDIVRDPRTIHDEYGDLRDDKGDDTELAPYEPDQSKWDAKQLAYLVGQLGRRYTLLLDRLERSNQALAEEREKVTSYNAQLTNANARLHGFLKTTKGFQFPLCLYHVNGHTVQVENKRELRQLTKLIGPKGKRHREWFDHPDKALAERKRLYGTTDVKALPERIAQSEQQDVVDAVRREHNHREVLKIARADKTEPRKFEPMTRDDVTLDGTVNFAGRKRLADT